jgi:hypothetical protein
MLAIPSELYIQKRVGLPAFRRGQSYFREGAIHDGRVQGDTLRALCRGSQAQAYRLRARLDERRVLATECSCPVGSVGRCKHMAALLLAWRHRPWTFREVAELGPSLEARPKEQVVALLVEVFRLHPELEWLAEAAPEGEGEVGLPRAEALSSELFRLRAAAILKSAGRVGTGDRRGASERAARGLRALRAVGDEFLASRQLASAVAVYDGTAGALLEHDEGRLRAWAEDEDDDDGLMSVVEGCVLGLGRCFAAAGAGERGAAGAAASAAVSARAAALRALFLVCRVGLERGGLAAGDEAAELLLEHATLEERRQVGGWLRHVLGAVSGGKRPACGGLILRVEAPLLDDEGFLAVARASGRAHDEVERLLAAGRGAEAVAAARAAPDGLLLAVASSLERHGRRADAVALVSARAKGHPCEALAGAGAPCEPVELDADVLDWLRARVAGRGKQRRALELAVRAFRQAPSAARHRELRALAEPLGAWPHLSVSIRNWLADQGFARQLIAICLDEGALDEAVEALRGGRAAPPHPEAVPALALQVARAAELSRPGLAIELYQELAEAAIEARGRENYRKACVHLGSLARVCEAASRPEQLAAILASLRARHHALRAFLDELGSAPVGRLPARGAWVPLKASHGSSGKQASGY